METITLTKKQNQEVLNSELFKCEIIIITPDVEKYPDLEIYGTLLCLNYNVIKARNKYIHDYGDIEKLFTIDENSLLVININNDTKFKQNLNTVSEYCGGKYLYKPTSDKFIYLCDINSTIDSIGEFKPAFINKEIPKLAVVKVADFVSLMDNIRTRNIMSRWTLSKSRDKIFGKK